MKNKTMLNINVSLNQHYIIHLYGGVLKMVVLPVTIGLNTKSWSNDLDDLGVTPMT